MMSRIIGVNSNCYHGYSIDEALEGIAAAGFHYVELTATKGWTEHVFPDQSFASLCHVQDKTERAGSGSLCDERSYKPYGCRQTA